MIVDLIGYTYPTEQEAIDAVQLCDTYYGLPVPGGETEHWCSYWVALYDIPIFWYIIFDESLRVVLGDPIEFQITEPDNFIM
jgi:hypothetical protein